LRIVREAFPIQARSDKWKVTPFGSYFLVAGDSGAIMPMTEEGQASIV
jgi:hypothetical protein